MAQPNLTVEDAPPAAALRAVERGPDARARRRAPGDEPPGRARELPRTRLAA